MRSVLITGAAQRLGLGMALGLAHAGWRIVVHYNRSEREAEQAVSAINSAGGSATSVSGDLTDPNQIRRILAVSNEDADAPLYGLINNAAIFEYDNPRDFSLDAFDRHIASNLRAPLQLAHLFATQAVSNGQQGCIVNILDQKLFNLNPDYFSYTVSKYALLGATTMQAMSYGPMVRVNAVALGLLLPSGDQTDDEFEVASTHNILRRRTTIDDVVGALQFILTNPGCSGQVLKVDSGQHLLPLERDVMFKLRESS